MWRVTEALRLHDDTRALHEDSQVLIGDESRAGAAALQQPPPGSVRSSSMPRPGVGSPLRSPVADNAAKRSLAAQSAPSLQSTFDGDAGGSLAMSPDDFPALGSGGAGGTVRQPTVWTPQGALQAAASPLKPGAAAAAASSGPGSPELRRASESRTSLSSWAEVSSRRPSTGASPRGAEYRAQPPRGLPQRLHSAEGGGRHLAVVTMPYSAPASVAGGASPPAGNSVAAAGTATGAPSTVSEALDGSSSVVGSASPRSSIASAPPASGRGAGGISFASAPPTLEGDARYGVPPPATTTEYPPLPTSGRSSIAGRGTPEANNGPDTGRDGGGASHGPVDGVGDGSNGVTYGDADHSARLEAGIAALQLLQAQPPAATSPSRVSYRQVAITAPPPAQADPVTVAAAAAARAQAGLRRTVSQASVASGSDSGAGVQSSQRGLSRSVSAASTADAAGGPGGPLQNGRHYSQQQQQPQRQQQGGFSQPRQRSSLPSRSFEGRSRGLASGSYGRTGGPSGPFDPAGRGPPRKSGSRTSRDSTASESASSQGAGLAGPANAEFALEEDFPSLSVASRLASRSR